MKFHDLRKTFGSLLAQNGVSTVVTQRPLEYSSPYLTNKVYTNVDPVLRQSVNQLPVDQWLQISINHPVSTVLMISKATKRILPSTNPLRKNKVSPD